MLRVFIYVLFSFGLISTSYAIEPQTGVFYLGVAGGGSELEDDGIFREYGLSLDESDTSISLLGGYSINRNFAVEMRYSDLGTFEVSGWAGTEEFDVEALSVLAVGILPLEIDGWALFGHLGLAQVEIDCDICSSSDETTGAGGVGVQYSFTESFSVALQIDVYVWEEEGDYDEYEVSVTTTQVAMKYAF